MLLTAEQLVRIASEVEQLARDESGLTVRLNHVRDIWRVTVGVVDENGINVDTFTVEPDGEIVEPRE